MVNPSVRSAILNAQMNRPQPSIPLGHYDDYNYYLNPNGPIPPCNNGGGYPAALYPYDDYNYYNYYPNPSCNSIYNPNTKPNRPKPPSNDGGGYPACIDPNRQPFTIEEYEISHEQQVFNNFDNIDIGSNKHHDGNDNDADDDEGNDDDADDDEDNDNETDDDEENDNDTDDGNGNVSETDDDNGNDNDSDDDNGNDDDPDDDNGNDANKNNNTTINLSGINMNGNRGKFKGLTNFANTHYKKVTKRWKKIHVYM
ncbi:hypothetical protein ACE6H2_006314 [Prunus campanulata]